MSRYQPRAKFDQYHLVSLDIETISGEEMEDGAFPPWCTHFPVVASMLTADLDTHGEWHFALESVRFGEDDQPLERIDQLLRGRSCITMNGRGFDFPVLMLAAQGTRNFCLPAMTAAASESRFESALHYDLAEKYSNYGSARGSSLAMLCESLGIAAKVTAHGDEVAKLYDEGQIEKIVQYCSGDVCSNLLLAAHCRAMETCDPAYHASLTYQFVRWIREQGCDYLAPFAEIEDLDDLVRQSLIGQIDAALYNARLGADLQAKRALDASFTETVTY